MGIVSLYDWGSLTEERIVHYTETQSTNSDAFALAEKNAPTGTWIVADHQISGKGRSGRKWISIIGNLHASFVLREVQQPSKIPQLSIVAGVAFHQALFEITKNKIDASFELKWPNDILLCRCKIGGILIESALQPLNNSATVVIGFGLNLRAHPEIEGQPATNLHNFGISLKPLDFIKTLDQSLYRWIGVWSEDDGLQRIKEEWLRRSLPIGTSLITKGLNGTFHGTFLGISQEGYMILRDSDHFIKEISFGDVSIDTSL